MHFKQSQKFRVIINRVCFYATAKQIRNGIGDFIAMNFAVQAALTALENMQNDRIPPIGLVFTDASYYNVQLDKAQD